MSAPPTGVLFYDGRAKPLSTIGLIQPGAYYQFYLTGTLTLTNIYADGGLVTPLSQTPGTGGTTAASDGRLPTMYANPATTYRYQLYSAVGVLLEDVDPWIPVSPPTATQIGQALYPQTAAEVSAGVTPVNFAFAPGNILRYGTNTAPGTTDMTVAFNNAVAVAQSSTHGHGFVYLPAAGGPYNFASPSGGSCLTLTNVQGIQIYGDAAAITTAGTHYANNTVLIFDGAASGSNAITVNTFIGFKMHDLVISMRRGVSGGVGTGGGTAVYLNSGHDFELDNVKVDLAVGTTGIGVNLGGGSGATSTFLGRLTNVKVMSDGGVSFQSNNTNTSLAFENCYSTGGYYLIESTVYSSFIACAADGAPAAGFYAYIVKTASGGSPNQGLSFISCGAESSNRGAWYVNGAENCTWVSPFGANNNTSATAGGGSLFEFDSTGTTNSNNTIISPTDASPNAATTASIYANVGNGTLQVLNANANYLSKGIAGDSTWLLNYLTVNGDSNLEIQTATATLGAGWTNVGTPLIALTYIKQSKLVTISLIVTPGTSIEAGANAQIVIPWTPAFTGSATQVDGANVSYGVCTIAVGKIFCQATGVLTTPLHFQGSFYIA